MHMRGETECETDNSRCPSLSHPGARTRGVKAGQKSPLSNVVYMNLSCSSPPLGFGWLVLNAAPLTHILISLPSDYALLALRTLAYSCQN